MFSQIAWKAAPDSSSRARSDSHKHNLPRGLWPIVSLILIFGCVPSARAQVSASVKGVVTDPSGASLAAANVTARNTDTGFSRTATTDSAGNYLILALPIGLYEMRASKS